MKKIWGLCFLLVSMSFVLSGCLTTPSTPFAALAPASDTSLVYVYRPESPWYRGTPHIVYAGEGRYEPLINDGYFPLQVQPGTVQFRLTRKATVFNESDVDSIVMALEAGKTYYLKVEPHPYGAFKFVIMNNIDGKKEASATVLFAQQ